jgi:hypothetical protein
MQDLELEMPLASATLKLLHSRYLEAPNTVSAKSTMLVESLLLSVLQEVSSEPLKRDPASLDIESPYSLGTESIFLSLVIWEILSHPKP